jgi:hypothetical protein
VLGVCFVCLEGESAGVHVWGYAGGG